MDLSPSASEASKLLEAALEQMDGIIQGAKFEIPAKNPSNPVSEALRNLHTCLLREDAAASQNLASVESQSIEFVFNWLRNNLMFDPGKNFYKKIYNFLGVVHFGSFDRCQKTNIESNKDKMA